MVLVRLLVCSLCAPSVLAWLPMYRMVSLKMHRLVVAVNDLYHYS